MVSTSRQFSLAAQLREQSAPILRRQGQVPAVLYGHGIKNLHLQVDFKQFDKIYRATGNSTLINLTVASGKGKPANHAALVREVQYHPVTSQILHIDFFQVRLDEKIKADVPFKFIGESVAVKDLGGVLVRNLDEIELEALPLDLPREIIIDISQLKDFDSVIQVKDLNLPTGVSHDLAAEEVVALVQAPRSEEELQALSEEVKEDVAAVEGVADKPESEAAEAAAAESAPAEKTAEK